MKYCAALLIALSFSMAGYYVSIRFEKRIAMLEKIYLLFADISSRIEFTADCVADIFSSLVAAGGYRDLPFVNTCAQELMTGEGFDSVWQSSLSEKENVAGLKKEDISILLSFGAIFGTTDVAGQVSNCKIHKKLIEAKIEEARRESRMYSKPVKGIGVLAGIAVLILSV